MARRRGRETVRDMLLSLGVVMIGVVAFVLPQQPQNTDAVRVIDPTSDVRLAAQATSYPVEAPVGLPAQWRPTSARVEPSLEATSFSLGYNTPLAQYAGLFQSDADPGEYVAVTTRGLAVVGSEDIAGETWQRHGQRDEDRAYSRTADGFTQVVVGTASYAEQRELIRALRPIPEP